MYEIFCKTHFSSAHFLRNYPGNCEKLHGHNWQVKVVVEGKELNDIGVLIDFRELKTYLSKIIKGLDHINLNEHPAFLKQNPSSELIAKYIFDELKLALKDKKNVRIKSVCVCETSSTGAIYKEP